MPFLPTRRTDHEFRVRRDTWSVNNGCTMARAIIQLRITLDGVEPTVWRRVLIPGGFTLDRVHRVVQFAMGWGDRHLHVFDVEGVQYGVPDPDGLLDVHDELDVRLDAVAQKGGRLRYTYDFGDWWEHDLTVEDVFPADLDSAYPVCTAGERSCPPDDVGGPDGYRDLLAAVADPGHPDHAAMRDWLGHAFDPASFDASRVTTLLRRMT
jgi:hypothetical protein